MAINNDIHHTDMNRVWIFSNQIFAFTAPLNLRRCIFRNKSNSCWSPEQLDTRFNSNLQLVSRFIGCFRRNIFDIQPEDGFTVVG